MIVIIAKLKRVRQYHFNKPQGTNQFPSLRGYNSGIQEENIESTNVSQIGDFIKSVAIECIDDLNSSNILINGIIHYETVPIYNVDDGQYYILVDNHEGAVDDLESLAQARKDKEAYFNQPISAMKAEDFDYFREIEVPMQVPTFPLQRR